MFSIIREKIEQIGIFLFVNEITLITQRKKLVRFGKIMENFIIP